MYARRALSRSRPVSIAAALAVSAVAALSGPATAEREPQFNGQMAAVPECESGVDTRELPAECIENAPTPAILFEKLRQWGFDALVVPHGLAWGIHAPPGPVAVLPPVLYGWSPDRPRRQFRVIS